jgi:hypothetical protein
MQSSMRGKTRRAPGLQCCFLFPTSTSRINHLRCLVAVAAVLTSLWVATTLHLFRRQNEEMTERDRVQVEVQVPAQVRGDRRMMARTKKKKGEAAAVAAVPSAIAELPRRGTVNNNSTNNYNTMIGTSMLMSIEADGGVDDGTVTKNSTSNSNSTILRPYFVLHIGPPKTATTGESMELLCSSAVIDVVSCE